MHALTDTFSVDPIPYVSASARASAATGVSSVPAIGAIRMAGYKGYKRNTQGSGLEAGRTDDGAIR